MITLSDSSLLVHIIRGVLESIIQVRKIGAGGPLILE